MKDQLNITDHGWKIVQETFSLPPELGVSRMVNYRKQLSSKDHLFATENLRGYTYHIREMLISALRLEKIPAGADVTVKFSLDAGTMIKGSRQ